jgi:hypothetical protein
MSNTTDTTTAPPSILGTEKRSLPCKLTDPERLERGASMAELAEQAATLKEEAAAISATARGHAKQAGMLAHILYTGVEAREIPCEWRADYTARTKTCHRLDTGAPLETMPLTTAELQLTLEAVPPPPPPTPIGQAQARARGRGRGRLQAVPDAAAPAPMDRTAPAGIYHEYETSTPAPAPAPDTPTPNPESTEAEPTNTEG